MTLLDAIFWGAISASSLVIGAWLALHYKPSSKLVGLAMGFGAGALIGAVAYELLPTVEVLVQVGALIFFGLGALVFYGASIWIGKRGTGKRGSVTDKKEGASGVDVGAGHSIALGALLDGIPESLVLGMTLALGGGVDVAFLGAVFASNLPESLGATIGLKDGGQSPRRIYRLWAAILVLSTVFCALGYLLITLIPSVDGTFAKSFAAGAVLTMLANSMIPEAYRDEGSLVGLMVVLGFSVAATLTFLG
jgi:ZIP family zinc transporter